jgi:hypothetical protein
MQTICLESDTAHVMNLLIYRLIYMEINLQETPSIYE